MAVFFELQKNLRKGREMNARKKLKSQMPKERAKTQEKNKASKQNKQQSITRTRI